MLGGLGLALFIYNLFIFAMVTGLNHAIIIITQRLIEQDRKSETSRYLISGFIINTIISVPLILLLAYAYPILLALRQDAYNSYQAADFLTGLLPGVFFIAQGQLFMFYLNAYGYYIPGIIAALLTLVVQTIINFFFYIRMDLGLTGGGYAASIGYVFQFIFLIGCLFYFEDVREGLFISNWFLKQWGHILEFLKTGIPTMTIQFLYLLSVESIMPIAGLISPTLNAAEAVVAAVYHGVFTLYFAFESSSSQLVSQAMSTGNLNLARLYSRVSSMTLVAFTAIPAIVLLNLSDQIGTYFSIDLEVQSMSEDAVFILSFVVMIDSAVISMGGILRGLGEQEILIIGELTFTLLISVPVGCLFAFALGLNLQGFWIGYLIKSVLQLVFLWFIIWKRLNWQDIARKLKRERKQRLKEAIIEKLNDESNNNINTQEQQRDYHNHRDSNRSYGTIEKSFGNV